MAINRIVHLLRRDSRFTLIVVVTLGIGIGAASSTCLLAFKLLRSPLPGITTAGRYNVWLRNPRYPNLLEGLSGREATAIARKQDIFKLSAMMAAGQSICRINRNRMQVGVAYVSWAFFNLLNARLVAGRSFSASDDGRVAVIGDGLALRVFGGAGAAVGKTVSVHGNSALIIGVLPMSVTFPAFTIPGFPTKTEIWLPIRDLPLGTTLEESVLGEPRSDISSERLEAELAALAVHLHVGADLGPGSWQLDAVPLNEEVLGNAARSLRLLALMGSLALLIALGDAIVLVLQRAATQETENAVRAALGAASSRILRGLVAELICLGALAGVFGWLSALIDSAVMRSVLSAAIPREAIPKTSLLFAGCILLGLASAMVLMVFAAHRAGSADPRLVIRGVECKYTRHSEIGEWLVVGEFALALAIVIPAIALAGGLVSVEKAPLGMSVSDVIAISLSDAQGPVRAPAQRAELIDTLSERIAQIQGVDAVAVTDAPILAGASFVSFPLRAGGKIVSGSEHRSVSASYFRVLGIRVLKGRVFGPDEMPGGSRAAVVNAKFARVAWGLGNPLGQKILAFEGGKWKSVATVIGVVGNTRDKNIDQPIVPEVYTSIVQNPPTFLAVTLVVRISRPLVGVAQPVRAAVWSVFPERTIASLGPLPALIRREERGARKEMEIAILLAIISLALAVFGTFAVLSFWTVQHRREIGVRLAMGARPRDVAGLVVWRGVRLSITGQIVGLGFALMLEGLWGRNWLQRLPSTSVIVGAVVVLALAGLCAALAPSLEAARSDPADLLRAQ